MGIGMVVFVAPSDLARVAEIWTGRGAALVRDRQREGGRKQARGRRARAALDENAPSGAIGSSVRARLKREPDADEPITRSCRSRRLESAASRSFSPAAARTSRRSPTRSRRADSERRDRRRDLRRAEAPGLARARRAGPCRRSRSIARRFRSAPAARGSDPRAILGRGDGPTSSAWRATCGCSRRSSSARYRGRILNIHPALLPKFPGLHAQRRALEAGEAESGLHGPLRRRGDRHRADRPAGKVSRSCQGTRRRPSPRGSSSEEHRAYPEAIARVLAEARKGALKSAHESVQADAVRKGPSLLAFSHFYEIA